jgi:hypothetical protein
MNSRGSATVIGLIVLTLAMITGSVMLSVSRMDRNDMSGHSISRTASQASYTAIKACEGTFFNASQETFNTLQAYMDDPSQQWLLSKNSTREESMIKLDNEDAESPLYSAKIIDFAPGYGSPTPFITVEGIGYSKKGKDPKKSIAIYNLKGLAYNVPPSPKYALYISSEGYDFNQYIFVTGDAYFGSGFRFNSQANGSIIDGNLKTGDNNKTSELNAGLTVNGKAFFQTPLKIQNNAFTVNGPGGFEKNIELSKNIVLSGKSFFNDVLTGSAKVDLTNHDVDYHACNPGYFTNTTSVNHKGSTINIPSQLDLDDGDAPAPIFNLNKIESFINDVPSATTFTGVSLQKLYAETSSDQLWNGFLVLRVKNCHSVSFNSAGAPFQGKVIWIIENCLAVNGQWYRSCAAAETVIYVTDGGTIEQLGWNGQMNGYIYVTGSGSIIYSFNAGSSLVGAINHVNESGFQVNTSNLFTLTYGDAIINELSSYGLIKPTTTTAKSTLKMVDAKIRPELLSLQL